MHRVQNYGSLLQAWATLFVIRRLGYDVALIDYRYPTWYHQSNALGFEHQVQPGRFGRVKSLLRKVGVLNVLQHVNYLRRQLPTKRWVKRFWRNASCPLTHACCRGGMAGLPHFDVYVVGSDQCWNPRYLADDHTFLFDFLPSDTVRISYATSFGCSRFPEGMQNNYGEYLKKFAAISVRERSGVRLVRELAGRDAVEVLDPTLLLEKKDYAMLVKSAACRFGNVVFVYLQTYVFDPGPWVVELAIAVARKISAKVVVLADDPMVRAYALRANVDVIATKQLPVGEFLTLMSEAAFVITSSFHGTAFSLNFKKNFYSIINPNPSADDRVASFLERFGLSTRGVLPGSDIDKLAADLSVDYSNADRLLAEEREKSLGFLKQALGGVDE